ncbi:hypothetical protein OROGR_018233 [Orobanche gracilis]
MDLEYTSLFHGGEERVLPSSAQGTPSLNSMPSADNSLADMYRSPPRPMPYDVDPRYFRLPRGGLVSRREKGSSHLNEEIEPLRPNGLEYGSESVSTKGKWNDFSSCDESSKDFNLKSALKASAAETTTGFALMYETSDDEDVCPTCLEDFEQVLKLVVEVLGQLHLSL